MPLSLARWVVAIAAAYLAVGVIFAVPFVLRWSGRADPVARSGTAGFRMLILPGSALLWPILIGRILPAGKRPPEEVNAHRLAARSPLEEPVRRGDP